MAPPVNVDPGASYGLGLEPTRVDIATHPHI
jgi:hypothetical protein